MKRIFLLTLLTFSTALVEVTAQKSTAEGQKYALIVGISGYPNFPAEHQLKYADQDAIQFKNFIQSPEGGAFPAANIRLLTNANATRDRIEGEIEWLSGVRVDRVLRHGLILTAAPVVSGVWTFVRWIASTKSMIPTMRETVPIKS